MLAAGSTRIRAIVLCGLLAVFFAITAWAAAERKSYTPDEPGGTLNGWFMLYQHDFRFSDIVPPLWAYWIALPSNRNAIPFNPDSTEYRNVVPIVPPPVWSHRVPLWLMRRARMMCLILGVALALLIARWAWQLGGFVAAISATFLYCFDPNFLAHAPLVKNDVGIALLYLAAAHAIWKAGIHLTWPRALAIAVLTAATLMVKFSGALLGPVLILTLGYRALIPTPWPILGRTVRSRAVKVFAAAAVCLLTALITYAVVWASYDFRFNSGPDGLNVTIQNLIDWTNKNEPSAGNSAGADSTALRLILAAEAHRLIPEGLAVGLASTQINNHGLLQGYLLGKQYDGGTWRYFPLAFLFKEPLATIAAVLLALMTGCSIARRRLFSSPENRWTVVALAVPAAIYAIAAIESQINIGYRHVFPVLPFLFIAVGLAAGEVWKFRPGRLLILVLGGALAAETIAAFPDFLAFFNAASMSNRVWLLSDSNFDWGQDLTTLADWQTKHPGVTIYLNFFGHDIPAAYGLEVVSLTDRHPLPARPTGPAVAAVSMTLLQLGNYDAVALRQLGVDPYSQPDEILGGTLCIFRVPARN
jgi:hypothetical protein